MAIPLTFLTRYAIPLIVAAVYLGDNSILEQFDIFEKNQLASDQVLALARHEGEPQNGQAEVFDYVVVGGGSAGAILANRLSASGENRVLLLEAGGEPNPVLDIVYAQRFYFQKGDWLDWGYSTVKQANACGNRDGVCIFPRGKALGGSSSVNGLVYNRCKPKDYDGWANFTGDDSWSWNNVRELFNSIEDYHGFYEATAGDTHGKGGEMYVGKIDHIPGVEVVQEALREKGIPLGDLNAGESTFGFGNIDYTIKNGLRWGTYQAFLQPILNRTNLSIYRYAYATQVVMDKDGDSWKATGVKYERHGKQYEVQATKEVILSAGVVESPKILMLSGIGPKSHLEELGIEVKVDLPVGEHLMDHPGVPIIGKNGGFTVNTTFGSDSNTTDNLLEYLETGAGPLNNFAYWGEYASQLLTGYLSSKQNTDNSHPDVHLYVLERFTPANPATGQKEHEKFWFTVELDHPSSTGSIMLASKDPKDKPIIDPNFLANDSDFERLIDVIEIMMDVFMNSTTFERLGIEPLEPYDDLCPEHQFGTRAFWKCYIKYNSTPFMHPTSTCRMGPNAAEAVVDSKLRVFGTKNLRVVDSSTMPVTPTGNTNLPTMLIAARGAQNILADQ